MKRFIQTWLVDDDETYSTVLQDGLDTAEDIEVCTFHDCESVLRRSESDLHQPDVILLDIHLPGMSGLKAISPLRACYPGTKIIMLTVDDKEENVVKAIRNGAYGYVLKHSGLGEVVKAVRDAAMNHRHIDPVSLTKFLDNFASTSMSTRDYNLSERELEILGLIAAGLSRANIARRLGLAEGTVIAHYRTVYKKLGVHKISDAVAKVLREGLV